MLPQFDNSAISSILLWMDNQILSKGSAYQNLASSFYPINTIYNGYTSYSAPFNQFLVDSSITNNDSALNPTIISGIYIDGVFTEQEFDRGTGERNYYLDYEKGRVHFNNNQITISPSSTISGYYAIKDLNIALTNLSEEELLFETTFSPRPKTTQTFTGLTNSQFSYPCVMIKNKDSTNEPFAFGGMQNTIFNISALIFADSQFLLDATMGILRDTREKEVPYFPTDGPRPFNEFGDINPSVIDGPFYYDIFTSGWAATGQSLYVSKTSSSTLINRYLMEFKKLNPHVFFGVVDLTIEKPRNPH